MNVVDVRFLGWARRARAVARLHVHRLRSGCTGRRSTACDPQRGSRAGPAPRRTAKVPRPGPTRSMRSSHKGSCGLLRRRHVHTRLRSQSWWHIGAISDRRMGRLCRPSKFVARHVPLRGTYRATSCTFGFSLELSATVDPGCRFVHLILPAVASILAVVETRHVRLNIQQRRAV